ncbi:MAG: DUF1080 domain-containing protein [Candidatus Nealsonbacteria bacterium]|nr:DUF1080 domain-containing protein [Candidatus Nealsonbacteria bacterium]
MKRHVPSFALVILCGLLPISPAGAVTEGDSEPDGFATSLFDGKTLDGWIVTGCEADVTDGAIAIQSGNGLLRAAGQYTDFVLELDWKALKEDRWDSGIYFRCELPPKGRPWPSRYQINLRKDLEGNCSGLEGAASEGLCKPGQWNRFKLTVVGSTAALQINGKEAWKADGLEADCGYLCLQAEVPGGGQFLFRNVRITELGHTSLFDGKSLAGWKEVGNGNECWKVADGLLTCTGQRGSWLRSIEEHGDFNLRLEYKLKSAGNSGVYVRASEDGDHHGEDGGVEIQILDDVHPRYADLKPYQFSGSIYKVAAAQQRVSRPAGQWNQMEINCRGTDYRITHNGVVVIDAKASEFPELDKRRRSGFLGLQNHSEEVFFRNIRIGPPQP